MIDTVLIYAALILGVFNALLPVAKKIAAKTKNTTDDKVVEILEDALGIARALQKVKSSDEATKKR